MKKPVVLSSYCYIISALTIAVLGGVLAYILKQPDNSLPLLIWGAVIAFLFIITLLYMPLTISADELYLHIKRPLRTKNIPLSEISSAILCSPTMGSIRICGSGGFFGWHGWFRESDLGKYFAYYGKASDSFLVTLKNDRKYMLSCEDPKEIVNFINLHLK